MCVGLFTICKKFLEKRVSHRHVENDEVAVRVCQFRSPVIISSQSLGSNLIVEMTKSRYCSVQTVD